VNKVADKGRKSSGLETSRAVLLATQNRLGQEGVASIVKRRIAALPCLVDLKVIQLDRDCGWAQQYMKQCIEMFNEAIMRLQRSDEWQPMLVTVDDITHLLGYDFHFGSGVERSWLVYAGKGLQAMTFELHRLSSYTNLQRLRTCMAGTFIAKNDILWIPTSWDRGMRDYQYFQYIRTADVWGLLHKHMPTLPEGIPNSMVPGL